MPRNISFFRQFGYVALHRADFDSLFRTSNDGSRNGRSPLDKFAHHMSMGFSNNIYAAVTAPHPWSAVFPFVEVHFTVFWISCVESGGFPIRQKERFV